MVSMGTSSLCWMEMMWHCFFEQLGSRASNLLTHSSHPLQWAPEVHVSAPPPSHSYHVQELSSPLLSPSHGLHAYPPPQVSHIVGKDDIPPWFHETPSKLILILRLTPHQGILSHLPSCPACSCDDPEQRLLGATEIVGSNSRYCWKQQRLLGATVDIVGSSRDCWEQQQILLEAAEIVRNSRDCCGEQQQRLLGGAAAEIVGSS